MTQQGNCYSEIALGIGKVMGQLVLGQIECGDTIVAQLVGRVSAA